MYAYADHNFLIYCANDKAWRDALIRATTSGTVVMVLSPWHFYELGRSRTQEDLIDLAERINPQWILGRSDLQLAEFQSSWNSIWNGTDEHFAPIGSIEDVAAALHRTSRRRVANITLRDYVGGFRRDSLIGSLADAREVSQKVRAYSKAGKLFDQTKKEIDRAYVALQIARSEGLIVPDAVYSRVPKILKSQPISVMIDTFIDWQLLESLKAYKVEKELSEEFYNTTAVLNANRMVDRQHAVAALSYCDYFVTNDQELGDRITRATRKIPLKVAEVINPEAFINRLITS